MFNGIGVRLTLLAGISVAAMAGAGCSGESASLSKAETPNNAPQEIATPPQETVTMASAVHPGEDTPHEHTNRLINETSPYLLQHAHNPVDWYAWGEEALARAKEEDKPIFLSIGYSACHWCHVMERESFENEEIAAILNKYYISIKVDREERPDLDEIYMTAVQMMTGSGGWPMSVFLTPDRKPFYGGTYFPPDDRPGYPAGFRRLITLLAESWDNRRDEVLKQADSLTQGMNQYLASLTSQRKPVKATLIQAAVRALRASFDSAQGGFGDAPKFPSSPTIAVLLRDYARTGDAGTLRMAQLTLDKMARGGMYDHLGGGFHRYSTDAQWLVPHFEKMLYDNGQLVQVYLEAYQLTKEPLYRRVAQETLDYIIRDMTDESGALYSTEDADSEGEEGKFYVWDYAEIMDALSKEDGAIFAAYYNVKKGGNFTSREEYHDGKNILHLARPVEEIAKSLDMTIADLEEKMDGLKKIILEVRSKRVRPGLDDKTITSWNGLMIAAFAQGYQVLHDERYRVAGENAGDFILETMIKDGVLLRTYRKGNARLPAYLDDYAFMIVAFIDLYEATFDPKWLRAADDLAGKMIDLFWDGEGNFYFTGEVHKNLLVRTKPTYDGAEPSGNSMAALGLLRLAKLNDNTEYYEKAQKVLESNEKDMETSPRAYLKMLCAVDYLLYPPKEIAIAGKRGSDEVQALLTALHNEFVPNKVVAFVDPADEGNDALEKEIPLLVAKTLVKGQAAAYVCKNFACERPVTEVDAFLKTLGVVPGEKSS